MVFGGVTTFTVLLGLVISLALGIVAFKRNALFDMLVRRNALTEDGTLAALGLGLLTFVFGGWLWFGLLAVFFVTSSALSRYKVKAKEKVNAEFAKSGARDSMQVTANGVLAVLLAVAYFFYGGLALFAAYCGVIATVTADTWGTELGVLYDRRPHSLLTGKPVRVGTSGAVSLSGTFAAFLGALLIGVCTVLFALADGAYAGSSAFAPLLRSGLAAAGFALAVGVGGLFGAVVDSFFGATAQVMYYCPRCHKETERTLHKCGKVTRQIKGFGWFDNDTVNLTSSLAGGAATVALYLLLGL